MDAFNPNRERPPGIPVARDRVAYQVVRPLIDPAFEALSHVDSFGFRNHRNAHQAIERVIQYEYPRTYHSILQP